MRRGRKRRASEQGLFHQDNGSTPSVISPVQHNMAEMSSECVVVSAPKRAKIETQPTGIDETSCSHIWSISGSEAVPTSQTTDIRWTSESNLCMPNSSGTTKTHAADFHILSIADIKGLPSPCTSKHEKISTSVEEIAGLHDREDISSLHILSITDIEGVPNSHSSKRQEMSTETSNLSITSSDNRPSAVTSSKNEPADLHVATVNQCEEISVREGVRPVGDSLLSHKRPREQFEELFDAATLTRAKRRRKSHTGRRWRQVKGGSRGRRWRRWKKDKNWKRRERRKKNALKKQSESATQT